ncbi:MAG: chemotaxis protein [Herbinix sp.]|jgi:methyl-accepting chemotaxis protein|nr:chemotaxis protein [Herbinix sp.]
MKSIKTKLIFSFSILVLSVTLITGIISIAAGYRSLKQEAEYSLQLLAMQGAKLTESRMISFLSTLNILAQKSEIINMGWEVDVTELKEELAKVDFIDIGFVQSSGYTYYSDGTVRLMSDRPYIKSALEGNEEISDVIISRVTRKPEIEAAVPIFNEGEVIGALVGRMEADSLSDITKDIGFGTKGYSFMINKEGTIIAHPDTDIVLKRFNPIKEAIDLPELKDLAQVYQNIIQEEAGVTYLEENEKDFYAGYASIEGTEWKFVITADQMEVMSSLPKMVQMIIIIMIVVFVCSIGVVYLLDHTFTRPLIEITKQSKKIGELDIRENIEQTFLKQKDEIGTLAKAFQTLTTNLRVIITEITDSANQVSNTAQELFTSSQQSASVSEEISRTVEDIAHSAMEQASHTEAGLSKAALLDNKIEANHEYVSNLNSTTTQVTNLINDGLIEIETLTRLTNDNDLATKKSCDLMQKMKQSSVKIGDASKIISEMASQTNLLALNAAIEAARAGEAGKGFAVVAEEINKMATQSAESTRHINAIVKELQQNIASAFDSMNQSLVTSQEQQKGVADTIQKYKDISKAMKYSETAVEQLNLSEKDMGIANNEIKLMLQSLSTIAEQNAAGSQQAASSMEEQTATVLVVADICDRLTQLSENLKNTITRFQISEENQ